MICESRRSDSGLSESDLIGKEKTSTTGKDRRVAEFHWSLFRKAVSLNGPSEIALTFADYFDKKNADARRFDPLSAATVRFIEEIEFLAAAPVSLISTRFDHRSIIDRRTGFLSVASTAVRPNRWHGNAAWTRSFL